jgi:hypothetical protein
MNMSKGLLSLLMMGSLRVRKAVRSFGIACTWEEYMLFIYLVIYLVIHPNVVCVIEHIL